MEILPGYYYHLCGVDYNVTKGGIVSNVTEYLFLPFHVNVIGKFISPMSNIQNIALPFKTVSQFE